MLSLIARSVFNPQRKSVPIKYTKCIWATFITQCWMTLVVILHAHSSMMGYLTVFNHDSNDNMKLRVLIEIITANGYPLDATESNTMWIQRRHGVKGNMVETVQCQNCMFLKVIECVNANE